MVAIDDSTPETASSFTFTPLEAKQAFPSLQSADARDALKRWDLERFTNFAAFRFDQAFAPEQTDAFLLDFFSSAVTQEAAPVWTGGKGQGNWDALGAIAGPGSLKYERLPTTVLRLDFFDRMNDEGGVVRSGDIRKCFDAQCGEVLVSDMLRKLMLDETAEEWDLYSEAERKELIFQVMRRLAIGGGMNQYDDTIEHYLNLTRSLYKDLVAVQKTSTGALQVRSLTFAVHSVDGSSAALFPRPSPLNFCYVTVDPLAKLVKMWYSAWFPMM